MKKHFDGDPVGEPTDKSRYKRNEINKHVENVKLKSKKSKAKDFTQSAQRIQSSQNASFCVLNLCLLCALCVKHNLLQQHFQILTIS